MPPLQGSFDASQFKPNQGGEAHPIGKYDFQITNTEIVPTKDQTGGMFVVEFTTPAGRITSRYNLWNNNPKAVEIAHGQLSALCYATGIFKLDWQNEGAALRNGRGKLEVGYQKGEEPTADKPSGGYVEVKRVYDVNGNEPGKGPAAAPQPTQQGWQNGQQPAAAPQQAQPAQPAWTPGPSQAGQAPAGWAANAPSAQPPWAKG